MKAFIVSGRRYRREQDDAARALRAARQAARTAKDDGETHYSTTQRLLQQIEELHTTIAGLKKQVQEQKRAGGRERTELAAATDAIVQKLREELAAKTKAVTGLEAVAATRVKALESQEQELEDLRRETVRLAGERDAALATVSHLSVASNGWAPEGVAS